MSSRRNRKLKRCLKRIGKFFISPTMAIVLIVIFIVAVVLTAVKFSQRSNELALLGERADVERNAIIAQLNENDLKVRNALTEYIPGIICWGDALTAGAGGNGNNYPKILQRCINDNIINKYDPSLELPGNYKYLADQQEYKHNISVINMGVSGENSDTVLGRNGSVPFVLSNELIIPEGKIEVEIKFRNKDGNSVNPLIQGKLGMESVTIAGVEGVIIYNNKKGAYFFTRSSSGNSVIAPTGTEIITTGSKIGKDYVTVIFIGNSDGDVDPATLIEKQNAIIDAQKRNKDRYIIIGLHTGTSASRARMEQLMQSTYGKKYINLREYMSTQALEDAGISPSAEDKQRISLGQTPRSLLADNIHLNSTGYTLLGNLVYDRMEELGYFKEIKAAMGLK